MSIGIHRTDCFTTVQPELPESVLLAWVLLCGFTGGFDLIDPHRDTEGGFAFFQTLGVCPILILGAAPYMTE